MRVNKAVHEALLSHPKAVAEASDDYEALLNYFLGAEDPVGDIFAVESDEEDEDEDDAESLCARIYQVDERYFVLIVKNLNEDILDCLGLFTSVEDARSAAIWWKRSQLTNG